MEGRSGKDAPQVPMTISDNEVTFQAGDGGDRYTLERQTGSLSIYSPASQMQKAYSCKRGPQKPPRMF